MTEDEKRKLATRHAGQAKEYMLGFEPVKELRDAQSPGIVPESVHAMFYAGVPLAEWLRSGLQIRKLVASHQSHSGKKYQDMAETGRESDTRRKRSL